MTQGQILNTGERGLILQEIIKKYKPQNIVEIGTWKGLGSTFCIIQSLQKDQNFFSLESNRSFHQIAKNNLREYLSDNIKLIYGRIVDKKEVADYASNIYLDNNQKEWLNGDLSNYDDCPLVLEELPRKIDLLFLDGGEFSTYLEWEKLKEITKIVAMDDITQLKTKKIHEELLNDPQYDMVYFSREGNGFSVFIKKMNFIDLNKLTHLHDGKNIIFCKTDYLLQEFDYIRNLPNEVVLISGNSDYPITQDYFRFLPENVTFWFAENSLFNDPRLIPIPLGLECEKVSVRPGHGVGYPERAKEKERLLRRDIQKEPTKRIYSNFNINTNLSYRSMIKNICVNAHHIDWQEPDLSLQGFFDIILDYQMVICPSGNGVDTHRLWEVLYSGRIPITIKTGDYKIYELYEKFPIIVLDSPEDLYNLSLIEEKYNRVINTNYNQDFLDCDYWINEIVSYSKTK